jgi:hypothetical protein
VEEQKGWMREVEIHAMMNVMQPYFDVATVATANGSVASFNKAAPRSNIISHIDP